MDKQQIKWSFVADQLDGLEPTSGGFSRAKRGIISLNGSQKLFVKIGQDDDTKRWTKKEIDTYRFLNHNNYAFCPELLSVNQDESGFAIDCLCASDGWDWTNAWSKKRLDKTLEAMDALAAITPSGTDREFFSEKSIDQELDNGWRELYEQSVLREALYAILNVEGRNDILDQLDFGHEYNRSRQLAFANDKLVHNDVRADNCAWNETKNTVRLVDWNWIELGDRRLDKAATLVHVYLSGFDVMDGYYSHLDQDFLRWLAGFWFKASVTPIWPGGRKELRQMQLRSAITAFDLSNRL